MKRRSIEPSNMTIDSLETEMEETKNLLKRRKDIAHEFSNLKNYGGYISLDTFSRRVVGPYKLAKNLGSGSSCKVHLGLGYDGEKVAIKIISRSSNNSDTDKKKEQRIYKEVVMSTLLNHPNIVKLRGFYYNELYFFLVFEYVEGKLLLDKIIEDGPMDEVTARMFFRQLISAIEYMHSNFVVHRDLKIENVIIDKYGNIKIIDFGLSNFYDTQHFLTTFCGSLYFAAPELLNGNAYVGPEIDIWSLGIILYVLLCGTIPFEDKNVQNLHAKIKKAEFKPTKYISPDALDLLNGMINSDPLKRLTINDILLHKWTNKNCESPVNTIFLKRNKIVIDENRLNFLADILSFQFPNFKNEVKKYKKMKEKIENPVLGYSRPCVALYFLLCETGAPITYKKKNNRDEIYHQLTKISNTKHLYTRVFTNKSLSLPKIKYTYLKGLFNSHSSKELSESVIQFFDNKNIKYQVDDKNFICEAKSQESICRFKLAVYYNMVVGKYFLSTKFLFGDERLFKNVKGMIREMVRENQ
ncbi:putative serine/threonine-protein kinase KIN1 like protein [Dictyocoela muelleri]|nr:putative serine/threonine-protein kinase KIN1 like protein [Dictyocoela muelleri]